MIVLGIVDSKPAAAAVLIDGKVVAAVAEERLCRMKMARGMPVQAVAQVLDLAGICAADIDQVAVAQFGILWVPDPLPWDGWFEKEEIAGKRKISKLGADLAPYAGRIPFAPRVYTSLKEWTARKRQTQLPDFLRERYGITAPVTFYDHHYCHATVAYAHCNFDDALVVTLDGGGDGLSGTVWAGINGKLQRLHAIDSFHSLGNLYSYVTALCGFKAEKHEGKITGLAALGRPIYADILRRFIMFDAKKGTIRYRVPMYRESAIKRMRAALPTDFDRADLAASGQLVLEEIGAAFVAHWVEKTGLRNVAVAGGVFANVKFNQRVYQLPGVEKLFVYPGMSDDGLAIGSALAVQFGAGRVRPTRVAQMALGNAYDDADIETALQEAAVRGKWLPDIHEQIAALLADGRVVARFTGAMEFGPRALGNRSIMYQTTDPSVNDWLNERLKRTEFMPFAPATLHEYAADCYLDYAGAADCARFMTITFDCTPQMAAQSPGTVHIDNTARPQLVDAETAPDFHAILTAYHARTGIPSLVNTSFNLHGEPIVCSPADAIRSFQQGELDYLAIGNWLVAHQRMKAAAHTPQHDKKIAQPEG